MILPYGLGRNQFRDDRDVVVPPVALPVSNNPNVPRLRLHATGKILNQGLNDQCVNHAAMQLMKSEPIAQEVFGYTVEDLHRICQNTDEWRMIQPHFGTSARAAMKVYQKLGYIKNYWFVITAEDVMRWILARSPVLIGVQWFEEMLIPVENSHLDVREKDDKVWILPRGFATSKAIGGHEVLLTGANRDIICPDNTKGAVEITNSWGEEWGVKGKAWLPATSLAWLLANDGDAIVPTEQLRTDPSIYVEKYHQGSVMPAQPVHKEPVVNQPEPEPSKIGLETRGIVEITPGGNVEIVTPKDEQSRLSARVMRQTWNGKNVKVRIEK